VTVTPTPTVTPTNTPTATATNTPTPRADFIFADGFESGGLSGWSSNSNDNGDLSVSAAAALVGSQGLQAVINDNNPLYVADDTPSAEARYRARFYFDPNTMSMGKNNDLVIFAGYDPSGTAVLQLVLRFAPGGYRMRAGMLSDTGVLAYTGWVNINDAPQAIEVDWRAATAPGAADGGLTLWLGGNEQAIISAVDNHTRSIDSVRLGAVSGLHTQIRGTYYFDEFESHRATYIGP
jgi:hypothetical protein